MKKLFTALICAMIAVGVGGCGSKEKTMEEIGDILKNKMMMEIKYDGVKVDDSDYFVMNSSTQDKINVSGQAYVHSDDKNDNTYAIYFESDDIYYHRNLENGVMSEGIISLNSCSLTDETFEDRGYNSDCSNDDIELAKTKRKEIDTYLENLGITEDNIYDYFIQYIQNNKDDLKADYVATGLSNPEERVKQLDYFKNKDGIYLKETSDSFSDFKAEVYMFNFDKSQFAIKLENFEKVVVMSWKDNTIAFTDDNGATVVYDTKNNKWIENESDIENEIKAVKLWTAFIQYCTQNNILIDIN